MEDCCCPGEAGTVPEKCPECATIGKPVSTLTLKHMVKPEFLELADKPGFRFCKSPECEMVYFNPEGEHLGKADVRLRVGLKEKEDPLPLCYCFGFTEAMVREEIRETGHCTIPQRITTEIKAGRCACEIRNPQGSCCLSSVAAAVKAAMKAEAPEPSLGLG